MNVTIENNSSIDLSVLEGLIEKYLPYAQERMGYDKPVSISLISDEQNAADPLGRTAHYEPNTSKITIYVDGRHPKDMMRSISHELVHHTQNCRGDLDNMGSTDEGYAQRDSHLRQMEEEAYTTGNICFRDFEDEEKAKPLQETIYKGKGSNLTMNKEQLTKRILEAVAKRLAEIEDNKGKETPEVDLTEEVDEGIKSGLKSAATALGRATGWIGQKWSPHEWERLTPEDFAEALRKGIGIIAAVSNAADEVGPEKSGLSAEWQSKFGQAAVSLADVIHNVPRSSPAAEEEAAEEEVAAVDEAEVDERRKKVSGKGDPKLAGGRRGYTADTGEKINEEDAETVTEEETVEEAEESAPLKEWYEGSLYGKLTKLWAK